MKSLPAGEAYGVLLAIEGADRLSGVHAPKAVPRPEAHVRRPGGGTCLGDGVFILLQAFGIAQHLLECAFAAGLSHHKWLTDLVAVEVLGLRRFRGLVDACAEAEADAEANQDGDEAAAALGGLGGGRLRLGLWGLGHVGMIAQG